MSRIGRNDPCFCGSGKKFKRCHGSVNESKRHGPAAVTVYRKADLPEIITPKDISAYLEAFIAPFSLFSMPRVEALLHVSRAVETDHVETELATPSHFAPGHQSLRDAQDLLRYLLYEIFKRCPKGGVVRPTKPNELELARLTARKFSEISNLRDLDLMVSYDWGTAQILTEMKIVRFVSDQSTLADSAREHENFTSGAQSLAPAMSNIDRPTFEQSSGLLMDSLTPSRDHSITYSTESAIVQGFYRAAEESSLLLAERLLPEGWHVGPYSLSDYHVFYHLLQARCLMNSFAIHQAFRLRALSNQIPFNSASLILSREDLLRDSLQVGGLTRTAAEEIIRDLTYNPEEVPWTEVTYQPLIPLNDDLFAIVPIVVEGSSFDRNLLALIERLPWRKESAENLKTHRENEMLSRIEPRLQDSGFAVASRVGLGERTARVSDIDILIWSSDGDTALAVSLKWFYGPDSLQEVANHSKRYQKALAVHRKAVDYLQRNSATVWSNNRLMPPLSRSPKILPALVTFQDEVLDRDRVPDIPAVTLPQFISAIEECAGSLERLYDLLRVTSDRPSPEPAERAFEQLKVGTYTFEVPVLYF